LVPWMRGLRTSYRSAVTSPAPIGASPAAAALAGLAAAAPPLPQADRPPGL